MNAEKFAAAVDFGRALIETRDLDPVYEAVAYAGLSGAERARLCVAYWLFYHLGFSASASEQEGADFWRFLRNALAGAPRGAERRHFRGEKAAEALAILSLKYPRPESLVEELFEPYSDEPLVPFSVVRNRALRLPQFGPWIVWKLADMGERCLGIPVDFSGADLGIYRDPRQGAALLMHGDWTVPISDDGLAAVVKRMSAALAGLLAPPLDNRRPNVQEVETVLCKFKSHVKGHYPLGKDSREVAEGLGPWDSYNGRRLLAALRDRCPGARHE